MAAEKTIASLANRLLDLDNCIEQEKRRFTVEEAELFIETKKNKNTRIKTTSDVRKFREWLNEDRENRELHDIPSRELDVYLSRFLLSVRKNKGNGEFEPTTLKGIFTSICRYLKDNDYPAEPATHQDFRRTREVLKAKCKDLKEKGKGNKPNRSEPFTPHEIQILHEKKLLGDTSPQSLINSIWLNNTMYFGLRGRQEHLSMLWGDLELGITCDGVEYISFTERATKTRQGLEKEPRQFTPKMFEQKDDRACPVKMYKKYAEKRPDSMCLPTSKFYLSVNPQYGRKTPKRDMWFISLPMGKNTLGCIAKKMSEQAEFKTKHTNHSARKTSISNLLNSGCHPTEVAQLSGHKNLMSLNQYHSLSIERQQQMSAIIHSKSSSILPSASETTTTEDMEIEQTCSDEELIAASQEIEAALSTINTYEQITTEKATVINLPLVQSPGGNVHVKRDRFNPMPLFQGCTFHGAVNIVMK